MKTAIALLLSATVSYGQFTFTSQFSPGQLPLIDESPVVNGTWNGDITQNQGTQQIGANGLATGDGFARSGIFTPVDLTQNGQALHSYIRLFAAPGSIPPNTFSLTFYDSDGGSSTWTEVPEGTPGVFQEYQASELDFTGNLDWTKVNRFGLAGDGSEQAFRMTLDWLVASPVPEPGVTAVVTGLALAGFAVWRRRAKLGVQ